LLLESDIESESPSIIDDTISTVATPNNSVLPPDSPNDSHEMHNVYSPPQSPANDNSIPPPHSPLNDPLHASSENDSPESPCIIRTRRGSRIRGRVRTRGAGASGQTGRGQRQGRVRTRGGANSRGRGRTAKSSSPSP